jgi:hypothetical protein
MWTTNWPKYFLPTSSKYLHKFWKLPVGIVREAASFSHEQHKKCVSYSIYSPRARTSFFLHDVEEHVQNRFISPFMRLYIDARAAGVHLGRLIVGAEGVQVQLQVEQWKSNRIRGIVPKLKSRALRYRSRETRPAPSSGSLSHHPLQWELFLKFIKLLFLFALFSCSIF